MMWKVDPNVDAARRLPQWGDFHRTCGEKGLCFDHIERDGRRGYKCVAFRLEKTNNGGWMGIGVSEGSGKLVLDALGDAFAKSGYDIPEAAAMLAVGLQEAAPEAVADDDFDSLIDPDSFEDLL
jgi:hypothetical protein